MKVKRNAVGMEGTRQCSEIQDDNRRRDRKMEKETVIKVLQGELEVKRRGREKRKITME